ncbi:MAG: recombination protein RecR [Firmicutes bacterium]|nr:recombination protein RecR [Bacillota bacterium]
MNYYGEYVTKLIEQFGKLPGIGGRTAQRLAFYVLNMPKENAEALAQSIVEAREHVKYCSCCCNLTDVDPCPVCGSSKRDQNQIMVVESPRDMAAYEKTKDYRGVYHVLHGLISPMDGISPNDIRIRELLARINENTREVILAMASTIEGDTTAMYIARLIALNNDGVKVSRIAKGVPVGGELEYVDQMTLATALRGRFEINTGKEPEEDEDN